MEQNLPTKSSNEWLSKVWERVNVRNQNWLCAICGAPGTGKSYSALSIANLLSATPVSIKKNVYFDPMDIIKALDVPEYFKKGDAIILEEAGVGLGSREWWSQRNIKFGAVLQTFRCRNLILIVNVPDISFIDVQARRLFHHYMLTKGIDYYHGYCYLRVYAIHTNNFNGKMMFRYPVICSDDGTKYKVGSLGLPKPPQKLIDEYEVEKLKYVSELIKKHSGNGEDVKEQKRKKGAESTLTDKAQEIYNNIDSFKDSKGKISKQKIIFHYKIGLGSGSILRNMVNEMIKQKKQEAKQ